MMMRYKSLCMSKVVIIVSIRVAQTLNIYNIQDNIAPFSTRNTPRAKERSNVQVNEALFRL